MEFTAALRRLKVDAIRAAANSKTEKLEVPRAVFAARDTKPVKDVEREVLVGVECTSLPNPKLRLVAFQTNPDKSLWTEVVDLPKSATKQEANIPELNAAILKFATENLGKQVGDGGGGTLIEEALKAAGATKQGLHRWGRELGHREPWLPGDILQLESLYIKLPGFERNIEHQTAIIEELNADEVVILQQNSFPKGQVVQREGWKFKGFNDVEIVAFRPWTWPEDNPFPTEHPLRDVAPRSVAKGNTIDLMKLVDTRLDRVHGIWYHENKTLSSHCEYYCRMQIPVAPPKSYVLRMNVKRTVGVDQLGLGLVVDGHQTMLSIDTGGRATGLAMLDGKAANENESTHEGVVLPTDKQSELECRVEPGHVVLKVNGEGIVDWKGDSEKLTMPSDYAVPRTDWLFLSSHGSKFDIKSFTLETLKE
jgi:hypothetical protein